MFNFHRDRYGAREAEGRIVWLMLAAAAFTASGLIMASTLVVPYELAEGLDSVRPAVDATCVEAISPMGDAIGPVYFDDPLRMVGACQ